MSNRINFKNFVAVIVLGSMLAACSGGGADSTPNKMANTTTPTKSTTNPSVSPPIASGPVNVGASGNEAIDDVKTQNNEILAKLNSLDMKMSETSSNASKAASNSKWAKWIGIGIASALGLMMIQNGMRNAYATEDGSFSFGKFFKGLTFNTDGDRNDQNLKNSEKKITTDSIAGARDAASQVGAVTAGAAKQAVETTVSGAETRLMDAQGKNLAATVQTRDSVANFTGQWEADMDTLTSKVGEVSKTTEANLNLTKVKVKDLETKVSDSTTLIGAKETEIATLNEKLKSSTDLNAAQKSELEAKIAAAEAEKKTMLAQRDQFSSQLDSQKREAANMQQQLQSLQAYHDFVVQISGLKKGSITPSIDAKAGLQTQINSSALLSQNQKGELANLLE